MLFRLNTHLKYDITTINNTMSVTIIRPNFIYHDNIDIIYALGNSHTFSYHNIASNNLTISNQRVSKQQNNICNSCIKYYDGCNICICQNKTHSLCHNKYCHHYNESHCITKHQFHMSHNMQLIIVILVGTIIGTCIIATVFMFLFFNKYTIPDTNPQISKSSTHYRVNTTSIEADNSSDSELSIIPQFSTKHRSI